jgi:prephenate dehydratase
MTGMQRPRVAFQGERGAFSEEAIHQLFPQGAELLPCINFEELFNAISAERADYAVAPLENTLAGSVQRCYDLLLESRLHIVGEAIVPIKHCLIGCEGASLETIRTVASHPVALAQCQHFFAAHPLIRPVAADDTAGSVRQVMETADPLLAAIASANAAQIYGGKILARDLEDHSENYTRFALLAREPIFSADADKLTLVLSLANVPGALHQALAPLAQAGIDLIKIETRPIAGKPWQYRFCLDLDTHSSDSTVSSALREIQQCSAVQEFRVLGSYKSARNLTFKMAKEFATK